MPKTGQFGSVEIFEENSSLPPQMSYPLVEDAGLQTIPFGPAAFLECHHSIINTKPCR
jgi:hypothetical protein